jgi:hypothetical protein
MHAPSLKLNLGSGQNPLADYLNVDKFGTPDLKWDLEQFPWPWETSSVSDVVMNHVLEHLGREMNVYFGIVKELYRVCRDGGVIQIAVPHPRHDDFLNDPTHVRPITAASWDLFSKAKNREWRERHVSNTPLGEYLDVDFEIVDAVHVLDHVWWKKLDSGAITDQQVGEYAKQLNNVVKEIRLKIKVIKPAAKSS